MSGISRSLKSSITKTDEIKAFRNDARAKVTGRAQYSDDYVFPRMVHAVPVYSDRVRARILGINPAAALSMPGVLKVLTADDIPGKVRFGQIDHDLPLLAQEEIRYAGEPYALVVAETRDQALKAAELVELSAEDLEPIFHPDDALESDAPLLRAVGEDNLVCHHKVRRGDAEAALEHAHLIIEKEFHTGWFEHAYMEPEGSVCFPRQDGTLEIYGSLQHPVSTRRFIAAWLAMPYSLLEVFNHPVGGSFGGKDDTASAVAGRAALAALGVGRPVKIIYEREWSFRESYKRPPYRMRYRVGFGSAGEMEAAVIDILADSGAYTSTVPWSTWRSAAQCCGPYRVPAVRADVRAAATNNVFTGAFRGFGSPQVNFAVESLMDEAAERLGLTALEIRRKNMLHQGDATITGQVLDDHTVSLDQVMRAVTEEIGFEEKVGQCSMGHPREDGTLYGIGFAISYRGASVGAEAKDFCSCVVNCQFDGSILMETGIHENGQGAQSAMILAMADVLGVSMERIHYAESTTSQVPEGGTTVASRGTLMGTGAVVDAADKVKAIIADTLTEKLGGKGEDVMFADDRVFVGTGDHSWDMSWDEAMAVMYEQRVYPFAFGSFKAPEVSWDDETGRGSPYFTYVYSAQAAELVVDAERGSVSVTQVVAAHDSGRVVNPPLFEGQIAGGIVQGMGMALSEDLKVESGRILAGNYNAYKIPKSIDAPNITVLRVENSDPLSPYGSKGIGEPALELIAPAIANALYRATGRRSGTLPLTPKGSVGPWGSVEKDKS
ncbi:MAG: xanthine dehydrogenase family protein molybdopterin-binding subunit [Spirochaetaceae bacterium]|nr:xanthine dehydrogenase family protein molybdopterin-binding subunit [Spirochaetaceae bacterium]